MSAANAKVAGLHLPYNFAIPPPAEFCFSLKPTMLNFNVRKIPMELDVSPMSAANAKVVATELLFNFAIPLLEEFYL